MKTILFKILIAMLCGAVLFITALIFVSDHYWCFKDHDTCVIEEMDYYRGLKAVAIKQENERHEATLATLTEHYDSKIIPLKPLISTGRALEEYKKGNKQNVPEGFVALRQAFIPQALASSGETLTDSPKDNGSISTKSVMHFAPDHINVGRYSKLLSEINSPYAGVPIEKYCNNEGVKEVGCDILVSIAQSESSSGTNFRCNWKTPEEALRLGVDFYHNPGGFKDLRPAGERERTHPDENGCYLRRFDSFNAFWEFYVNHMVHAYGFDTRTEALTMYQCYVNGNCKYWSQLTEEQKEEARKSPWVNTINSFVERINKSNA